MHLINSSVAPSLCSMPLPASNAPRLAILPQIVPIRVVAPLNVIFVQTLNQNRPAVAISTITTDAWFPHALGHTNAAAVEAPTQSQIVKELHKNFNPLPAYSKTPINVENLSKELNNHPDKQLVTELINDLCYGFNIGYLGPEMHNIAQNLKSVNANEAQISEHIIEELKKGRLAGPFNAPPLKNFRTSPIGMVPKKDSSKMRMITDLSSPRGLSINDFISDDEASVHFNNFDSAVKIVAQLGRGAWLSKLDIKSAFRICPVRPADWHYLGFTFRNLFFVDLCLPMGLRSSVNRFTRLSDAISWIMRTNYGITHSTHYLDDYLIAGPASSDKCLKHMQTAINLFADIGVPLAPEKVIGPLTGLTFLGIEIDTMNMSLKLPATKFEELLQEIEIWSTKKKCTKRELLSLIGKLSFAAKVIPSGRTFLRRLIELSTTVSKLTHHITINLQARLDIQWWATYLPTWNGKYKILDSTSTYAHDLQIYTDASGELGFGIFFQGKWVSSTWPFPFKSFSIQWKELFPIYVTCLIWGENFRGKRLIFHCDNQSVVDIWSANSSKCPQIMTLLRRLFFIAATKEFTVNVKHIPGSFNSIADCLSRLQVEKFRQLVPDADRYPTPVPASAWQD